MDEQEPRRKRPLILAGLAGVVAVVLGGLAVINPASASDLATVRPLEPVVRLQQPDENVFKPVTSAVATNQGAKVETDASGMAEIAYFEGSLTRLGPDTDYELSTLDDESGRAIVGDLDIGRTYHRVTELTGSDDRYEVRTPSAVAAVRGTRFIVVCLPSGECDFGVIDGVIEVTSRSTSEMCVVRPGEALTVHPEVDCSNIRPLNLDDPWVLLNLELDGLDVEELRRRLFGDDRLPATDDDPAPDEVDGDGDGVGDGIAAAAGGGGTGGTGGGSGPGSAPGDSPSGAPGDGSGDEGLGGVISRPGTGTDGGQSTVTTERPGRPTTTTRPGQGSTTTTRRGQGTTTTRPGQGNTTTTRPSGTTTTTRPRGTTSTTTRPGGTTTTRPSTTSSTQDPGCTTGYPPRPC